MRNQNRRRKTNRDEFTCRYAVADFTGGDCDEDRPVVSVSNCSVQRRKSRRNGSTMKKGLRIEKQATDRTSSSPDSCTNAMLRGQRVAGCEQI